MSDITLVSPNGWSMVTPHGVASISEDVDESEVDTSTIRGVKSFQVSGFRFESDIDFNNICESEMNMDAITGPARCPSLEFGNFRLAPEQYEDSHSPYVRMRHINDITLDENEKNGKLSVRMVAAALSYLWRQPMTGNLICIKLEMIGRNLNDISVLRNYTGMVYLNLNTNNLTDLKVLSFLPNLQFLSVSHNSLTELLDYDRAQDFLSDVHFSFNKLTRIGDLTRFWSISYLNLSNNNIKVIKGLENLKYLRYLNLSSNHIQYVGNLAHLKIVKLDLSNNDIIWYDYSAISGLCTLPYLEVLNLNDNKISSLRILNNCSTLQEIHIKNNRISNILEISAYLKGCRSLRSLDMRGNPITECKPYAYIILNVLPEIAFFDATTVTATEKRDARMQLHPHLEIVARRRVLNMMYVEQLLPPCMALKPPMDDEGPLLVVLVGEEGVGKSYIAEKLSNDNPTLIHQARNHTTNDWIDKHVRVTKKEFDEGILRGDMISYAEEYGHFYGISRQQLKPPNNQPIVVTAASLALALPLQARGYRPYFILCHGENKAIKKRIKARYVAHKLLEKTQGESMLKILLSDSMEDFFLDFPAIEEELVTALETDDSAYSLSEKKSRMNAFKMAKNSLHTIYCKKLRGENGLGFYDFDIEEEEEEEEEALNLESLFKQEDSESHMQISFNADGTHFENKADTTSLKQDSGEYVMEAVASEIHSNSLSQSEGSLQMVSGSNEVYGQRRALSTAMKRAEIEKPSKVVKFGMDIHPPKINKWHWTESEEKEMPKSISETIEKVTTRPDDIELWQHFLSMSREDDTFRESGSSWIEINGEDEDQIRTLKIEAEDLENCKLGDCDPVSYNRRNPGFFWTSVQTDDLDKAVEQIKSIIHDLFSYIPPTVFERVYNDQASTIVNKKLTAIAADICPSRLFV